MKMRFGMVIEVEEEDFKRCLTTAWQKRFGKNISIDDIKPFCVGDKVTSTDITNVLLGSCLGELVLNKEGLLIMKRIG